MDPIVQILLSAGGATILAAIINAVMNRRKLSAEATDLISKAAASTVETVMRDNAELRAKIVTLEARLDEFKQAQKISDERERAHLVAEDRYLWHSEKCHEYTEVLAEKLREQGHQIPDPPPTWRPPGDPRRK